MSESAGQVVESRLRLTPGQRALALVVAALLIGLVASAIISSSQQRQHTENYVRTETSSTNTLYTMRESLNYSLAVQQYLLGVVPRRAPQIARALLEQRLSVVDENGLTGRETATVEYLQALGRLDSAIEQVPAGILPVNQRESTTAVVEPAVDNLNSAARHLADASTVLFREEARATDANLLRNQQIELVLLVLSLVAATALLLWIASNVRSRYRAAREDLAAEAVALGHTQSELERVSALDRGQARILEEVATGVPLTSVLLSIASLAHRCSGGMPARITSGSRVVQHPHGSASNEPVAWSGSFGSAHDGTDGRFELLGPSIDHDDFVEMVAQRCSDLSRLALERDSASRRLSYQATHDALTGLANRTLLLSELDDHLGYAAGSERTLALLFCDLDRFKMVNDSIGHAAGDRLLIEAASRLRNIVREGDVVARLGGDEFVVLCPSLAARDEAVSLAERVRTTLSAPYVIEGKEAFVGVSIGITYADERTASGAVLMREADVAMYRAKSVDGSHVNVFDNELEAEVALKLDLDSSLRRAIERNELHVLLQPMIWLSTNRITGFEALLRWKREGEPVRDPEEFVPLAEENGLIVEIGHWVLRQSLTIFAEWRREGLADGVTLSVNVSARQVRESSFADEVLRLLAEFDIPPKLLVIELTEHALVDLRAAHDILGRLRTTGVRVAMDDFGTGYSSLTQLRTLPVDQLKLDRSFSSALDERESKQKAVVSSVVALATALSLDLVVEGVETVQERDQLISMGVERAQGYLFGRPMAPDAAADLLRTQRDSELSATVAQLRTPSPT